MIKSEVLEITPEMAKEMLSKNIDNNRKLDFKTIHDYAYDMKAGNWQINGETINFNEDGYLINGQHRLNACIVANVPFTTIVVQGVKNDVSIYDLGKKRNDYNIMQMSHKGDNVLCNSQCISISSFFWRMIGYEKSSVAKKEKMITKFYDEFNKVYKLQNIGGQDCKRIIRKTGFLAGLFSALCNGVDADSLYEFTEIVGKGFTNYDYQKSAIVLRNYMLNNKMYNKKTQVELERVTEKAIYDFYHKIPRERRYKTDTCGEYFENTKEMLKQKLDLEDK